MALTTIKNLDLTSSVTGTLPTGNGGTGATSFAPSKILQIKNLASTATTTTSSSSYTATALDLSITPTSSSSKIIISMSTNTDNEAAGRQAEIGLWREIGGANNTVIGGNSMVMASYGVGSRIVTGSSFVYMDSPATTSVVRYRVVIKSNTSNQVLFGANMGSNSTILLQEATVA